MLCDVNGVLCVICRLCGEARLVPSPLIACLASHTRWRSLWRLVTLRYAMAYAVLLCYAIAKQVEVSVEIGFRAAAAKAQHGTAWHMTA